MMIHDDIYVDEEIDVEMINVLIFIRITGTWDEV